jgi:transcriptional regulator with XRE-family HTH domain
LREGKGWSQQHLSELAGCHRFTVAKLERGEQEPAWPLVLALAGALGVNCLAFTQGASQLEPKGRGGPARPKPDGPVPEAKKSRGRPRKEK